VPVVSVANVLIDPLGKSEQWTDVRVTGRTNATIVAELLDRFPRLVRNYKRADGTPVPDWFALWTEDGQDDLRAYPERVLGDDERLWLINQIGC
jgi:hypothetical protein